LEEGGPGYPPFMASPAYRTRALNGALASWAHRRQDTVLYAAQEKGMEMRAMKAVIPGPARGRDEGDVEPVPHLHGRLLALTQMARRGLADLKALTPAARERLERLERLLERLLRLAVKELEDRPLDGEDLAFLSGFAGELERAVVVR